MRAGARKMMVNTAEKSGIPWQRSVQELQQCQQACSLLHLAPIMSLHHLTAELCQHMLLISFVMSHLERTSDIEPD